MRVIKRRQGAAPASRQIVVMESLPQLRATTNPYLHQLLDSLQPTVEVALFSWRRALFGRFDVFHAHWPELMSRAGSRRKTAAKRALTWLFQTRLVLTRKAVVRTAHNIEPHETGPRFERYLLRRWDRLTTRWIVLNDNTPLPTDRPKRLIPHGHYSDFYEGFPRQAAVLRRLATVGQIRPYKGVEVLAEVFSELQDPDATLVVAGAVAAPSLAEELSVASRRDDRIRLEFGFVDDGRLVDVVTSASLVALPYAAMHNSGALILALSLGRPVLAPRNPVTEDLADEVGDEWVHRYDGRLRVSDIAAALDAGIPAEAPDLSGRGWAEAGRAHAEVFEGAIRDRAIPKARRGRPPRADA